MSDSTSGTPGATDDSDAPAGGNDPADSAAAPPPPATPDPAAPATAATAAAAPPPVTPDPSGKARRVTVRSVIAVILFALGAVLLPVSSVSYWAQLTLTETETFVATLDPLIADADIQDAIASQVSEQLVEAIDTRALAIEELGPRAKQLIGPISSAVESFVYRVVIEVLNSEQFQDVWSAVTRRLQQATIAALSGQTDAAVHIQGDNLVLDLSDVFTKVQEELVARGLTAAEKISLPPAADRQVVLMDATQLKQAQMVYKIAVPVARYLLPASLLLLALSVALARRRPRMLFAVAIAFLATAAILGAILWLGGEALTSTLSGTPFSQAGAAFFSILTSNLQAGAWIAVGAGVVVGIAAWIWSRTAKRHSLTTA